MAKPQGAAYRAQEVVAGISGCGPKKIALQRNFLGKFNGDPNFTNANSQGTVLTTLQYVYTLSE
jgi:hypothetical protein